MFIYELLVTLLILYILHLVKEMAEIKEKLKQTEEQLRAAQKYEKEYNSIKFSYLDLLDKMSHGQNKKKK